MLIIDDDAAIRDLLRLVFEYDGFHCWEAGNGAEGLTMLESQTFDIIILDRRCCIIHKCSRVCGFVRRLNTFFLTPAYLSSPFGSEPGT